MEPNEEGFPPLFQELSEVESKVDGAQEMIDEKQQLDISEIDIGDNGPTQKDDPSPTPDFSLKTSSEPKLELKEQKLSMCPHCRRVETELCRIPPLEELPPTHYYRFRDEESRLPALETLPPTRRYQFDNSADEGTARVYPDPEIKFELATPPFLCLLPIIILNFTYLAWLIADLCYSYGPYYRFKAYFASGDNDLNKGMEIFAGVFLFLTNMAFICKLVFRSPNYAGPSFSSASRGDKKWVARASIFGCLPVIMLIIMAAIRKHVPMEVLPQKPIPTCENLGYPTRIQFDVLDHATVRGNHTGLYNTVTISNSTSSGRLAFNVIYDPETFQNNFILHKLEGGIDNVTINYFLQSRQYTVNWHSINDTANILPEYIGGSWQEAPGLTFPNLSPALESKKLDNWQLKTFSDGSYLELFKFASGDKKGWLRTLDRDYYLKKTYFEACTMGGVEDVPTLVPSGLLLIEFAKDVYDTTDNGR
ncbi:hypothetical protein H072_1155 [Dactylellina haptotyla CBS 200.50]|uniref:Uncharacterized protein n=1 Tax=Dactylellina haptotyla (strain CBS 200.50) TaxID=1284197 RepID=S8CAT0_DACHA|nr:hypothetical protein H072_1155 [Dactylellina haptotyla CBS 200.50]